MDAILRPRFNRRLLIAPVVAFLLTRTVMMLHAHVTTDVRFYHAYYVRAASGKIQSRFCAAPSPPVSWWVIALPGSTNWPVYRDRFRRTMLVFDIAAFALFLAI